MSARDADAISQGSRARRLREKDDLRRAVMDAARDLFLTQGFDQVSMRKIAERIHYSHTAIYSHFKDKLEILIALSEEGFLILLGFSRTVQHADPVVRLRKLAEVYLQFAMTHPQYYRIMFLIECNAMMEKKNTDTNGHRVYSLLLESVRECQAAGAFDPGENPDLLAHVLWAHIHGLASLKLAERLGPVLPPGVTTAQVMRRGVEAIVQGFLRPGLAPFAEIP